MADILEAFHQPYKIIRELNLLYHRRMRSHKFNHDGVDIFAEDWDNLVLLDACRYDEFKRHWDSEGRLEYRISRGSSSNEFVRGNFQGRELLDTVCVTANPWYIKIDDFRVHAMIPLIGDEYQDSETGAVLPETVTEHAKRAIEEYPHKRLIIHYMQPHAPYIGPTGRQYFEGFKSRGDIGRYSNSAEDYDLDKIRTAYRENLEIVIEEVRSLLEQLRGKSVISADHGEMLGERHFPIPMRDYMHPHGIDNEVLTKVPWLVRSDGSRRSIVSEKPERRGESLDSTAVEEQLRELGYLQ